MADDATKENAAKHRIISHMNSDHKDSLIRYLEHFCHLSSFSARNARLVDISFEQMEVETAPRSTHHISIKPPMTTWSEARPRVVAMDHEAVAALGVSSITIKRYQKPYGPTLNFLVAIILVLTAFSTRANFKQGSIMYNYLLFGAPSFAHFCWSIQPFLVPFIFTLHALEMAFVMRTRLTRHTVPVGSILWLTWLASNLIEGYGAVIRFDELVVQEEAKRARARH